MHSIVEICHKYEFDSIMAPEVFQHYQKNKILCYSTGKGELHSSKLAAYHSVFEMCFVPH